MNKKLYIRTLGCTKNLIDSEVMLGKLKDYKITNEAEDADVIIVNTCGFIEAAKTESIETVLELHEERKEDSVLVMSGCLSERYQEQLIKEMPEVDIFTGVGDYDKIDDMLHDKRNMFSEKTYLVDNEERVITGSSFHAYIKLSEGCNQSCSFCAIPGFKGKLQSRDIFSIVDEVKKLTEQGFFDFTFISQDSSSYLYDKGDREGLIHLIKAIDKIEGVTSARMLYLYPSTASDELISTIINASKFHNYFDIPLQHISERMLKIMKRGSGQTRIMELLKQMKDAPNPFLRTAFIVGHPGESEEDFEELLEFVKTYPFDRISVFAYSDEEQTVAYDMEDKIPQDVINDRIQRLDDVILMKMKETFSKEVGSEVTLVTEATNTEHDELFMGAKLLHWAPEVDGEILINESDITLEVGRVYRGKITQNIEEKYLATVTHAL